MRNAHVCALLRPTLLSLLLTLTVGLGCEDDTLSTTATATPSATEVCEGEAFAVTLTLGGDVDIGDLQSRVLFGSATRRLVENQSSPNNSYMYNHTCTDDGPITIEYTGAEGADFAFETTAEVDCQRCIQDGSFDGADGGLELASANIRLPNGNVASVTVQAGLIRSAIYDHQGGFIDSVTNDLEPELEQVEIAQAESGAASAATGGEASTQVTSNEGEGFSMPETVIDQPTTDIARIPDTGDGEEFAVALNDYSVWRLVSEGSGWSIDPDRSADSSWITGCGPEPPVPGLPAWIAALRDFLIVMTEAGRLCHGWFGAGGMAELALEVGPGVLDLRCPPDRDGNIWTCGALTGDDLMLFRWGDETEPPVLANRLDYCLDVQFGRIPPRPKGAIAGDRSMGAVMPNDDEACFAIPCGNGVIEEICVGVSEQELRLRTVLELAGCGGDHVTYVNAGKIAASCDQGFQVATRPGLDGGGTGGTGGGNAGTGGTGGNTLDEPKLVHPCNVFTEADIEALTGDPMVETLVLDNPNRRFCEYITASGNGMRIDMEAQQNTASADFFEGWKERNSDATEVVTLSWSPEGELRVLPDGSTTVFAFVINDDPLGRNIFINLIGLPVSTDGAADPPALIRSVVETTSRQLNDAILIENGLPILPGP